MPSFRSVWHCRSVVLLLLCFWGNFLSAEEEIQIDRRTSLVRQIEKVEPCVVSLFAKAEEGSEGSTGSGVLIHHWGFVLTCDHVVRNRPGYAVLSGNRIRPYRIVARLPEHDLAILQLAGDGKYPYAKLGKSGDVMTGESIFSAGNPGGRGIIFTTGIISSRTAVTNIPNALVQAQLGVEYRRQFIQFDAGSNRGSSGGGLFNMHGEQMGVIAAKVMTEENINYAIPMGTFRRKAEEMIAAEIREGIYTGIRCNLNLSEAIVKEVDPDSPAGRAGVLPGDRIQKVNHFLVTDSIHWPLSLMFRKPGEDIELEYLREGKMAKAKFQLAEYPRTPADEILSDKLEKGLVMSVYEGERQTLPDFATLTPTKQLTVDRWENPEQQAGLERLFQLVYEGYLEIPHDKAIQFVLGSDDGSRLILDGKMVIDNDGHHPYQEESCWMRLEPGFHSIRLEYLEWHGDASLSLKWNASGEEPVEIPGQSLFRLKKAGSPDVTKPEEKEPETSDTNQNAS